jgi:hemolysin activation/secretion protein
MMRKETVWPCLVLFLLFHLAPSKAWSAETIAAEDPAGFPSYEEPPEEPTDTYNIKALQEALEQKMKGQKPAPAETNAPPLPTQLILAQPPLDLSATNDMEGLLELKLKRLRDAERRQRMLPARPANAAPETSTNAAKFDLKGYELIGNTLLPPDITALVLEPYVRSNATFEVIRQGLSDLQKVYNDRGYPTVLLSLPPQTLSNGIVKIRVVEGTIAEINVLHNHFYSSNNVMRALPSLHTNMILNTYVFQNELDRANANQDRQIYPQIEQGAEPGTSDLNLLVKDRLPLHAKVELNNQNSPGTPDLRLNTSFLDDNLWQYEHSLGVQYSFSPEEYKQGTQWDLYDVPLVANYSGFYRLPLTGLASVADAMTNNVGSFGYDEATRRFNLPPPSGQAELNIYASRSTIDTGVQNLLSTNLYSSGGNFLHRSDFQQELTVNNAIGSRLSMPLWSRGGFQSTLSGGLDYKQYQLSSYKTNIFTSATVETNTLTSPPTIITNHFTDYSAVPPTIRPLNYVPLALRFDASHKETWGLTTFGLGISGNSWYSGSVSNLHNVIGSTHSSGHWGIVTPSLGQDIVFHTNWTLSVRLDAQIASEPLPANEQFGAGGVNSVRGYHEGEVFGDDGWHTSVELKTPVHRVGLVTTKQPLNIRGSVYMDNARVFLLDPQGRQGSTSLWSAGFGGVASIGSRWEARFLFSVPFIATADVPRDELYFNFALSAQF